MSLSLLFAVRYLCFRAKESTISFMIKICFLSIFIGTTSLMVTLIIMNGFEKTISEKMQGINADLIVTSRVGKIDGEGLKTFLKERFGAAIKGISGSSIKQVIFDNDQQNAVVFVKGINPHDESRVCSIGNKIIKSATSGLSLEENVHGNSIIIGKKLAEEFGLSVGDTFDMLVPQPKSASSIKMGKKQVVISGIFAIGLEEFDHNFAYMDISFFNEIFQLDTGVDMISLSLEKDYELQIEKKCHIFERCFWKNLWSALARKMPLSDRDEYRKIVKKLRKELPDLSVSSWKDLHPALVSSSKLEKYVMFFILALITLVASMNMISLLFMQIQHKRRDIAILKSMGMMQRKIKNIFLLLGMAITTGALIAGLTVAAIIGYVLERYPFLQLPDVYFVSHLPARMEMELFFVVGFAVFLLGFLATWIPARRIESNNITEVLRQE
ncbi:ABC transporter permease [Candidatus Babeliales bacterium]|nr:ABC transporter permease [Candidatus Babeliales bacterium]